MASYEELRPNLRTGDIVLYSGKGPLSNAIKTYTQSRWSHVGMVFLLPDEWDFVTVWESVKRRGKLRDLDTGRFDKGVQLFPLRERIGTYSGSVAVRQLEGVDWDEDVSLKLMALRKALRDRPYEKGYLELFRAAYDGPFGRNEEDLSSVFCSELVAEAYQCMNLVNKTKPSNEYTPADFSEAKRLRLLKGRLTDEVVLEL